MPDVEIAEGLQEVHRTPSDWSSPKGLRYDILPWRLYERAKQLVWNPSAIDFSADAQH